MWDEWTIGECSKTCGTGTRVDTRSKLVEEANGGTCTGQHNETKECKETECPGISTLHIIYYNIYCNLFINSNPYDF